MNGCEYAMVAKLCQQLREPRHGLRTGAAVQHQERLSFTSLIDGQLDKPDIGHTKRSRCRRCFYGHGFSLPKGSCSGEQ
jgi:hypothetical protein